MQTFCVPLYHTLMGSQHTPETKASAEMLYVIERKAREAVCELLGISRTTFDRWKKAGAWDEKRGLEVLSIPYLVRALRLDMQRTTDAAAKEGRPLTAGERDGLYKNHLMIEKLDKGALFASHGIQIMDLFAAYLAQHAPELRQAAIPHIVGFTEKLTRDHVK